jgi:hypothetical protein
MSIGNARMNSFHGPVSGSASMGLLSDPVSGAASPNSYPRSIIGLPLQGPGMVYNQAPGLGQQERLLDYATRTILMNNTTIVNPGSLQRTKKYTGNNQ